MFVVSEKMNQLATFCLLSSAFAVEHHHQPIECVDYYDAGDDHNDEPDHYHEPESDDFIMIWLFFEDKPDHWHHPYISNFPQLALHPSAVKSESTNMEGGVFILGI